MANFTRSGKRISFVASGSYFGHERERGVMIIRKCRLFAFVIALWLSFFAMLPSTFAAEGKLVNDKIHSPALEGNLLGDSADRDLIVYLPPSYETSPEQRYPAVYLLHGSDAFPSVWTGDAPFSYKSLYKGFNIKTAMDKLVREGKAKEIIFVMLDANNRLGASWYLSSKTIGDYETYITKDLVSYIDNNYRTIVHRNSRGIAGFSMGGYGSMHLALKYPEIFSVVVAQAGLYDRDTAWKIRFEYIAPLNPKDFGEFSLLGFSKQSGFALAAAISPNPAKPPFFLDKPFELVDGKVQAVPEVWKRYADADITHGHLNSYLKQPLRLHGIMIVHGTLDQFAPNQGKVLDKAMSDLGIEHVYVEHGGGHHVLPDAEKWLKFLSDNLSLRYHQQ